MPHPPPLLAPAAMTKIMTMSMMESRRSGSEPCTSSNRALHTIHLMSASTTPDDDNDDAAAAAVLSRGTSLSTSAVIAEDYPFGLISLEGGTAAAAAAATAHISSKMVNDHYGPFGLLLGGDATAFESSWWRGDQFDAPRPCWSLEGFLDRYAKALEARPLLSKCVTSAVVGALGDLCAQGMSSARGGNGMWHDTQVSRSTVVSVYCCTVQLCIVARRMHVLMETESSSVVS